MFFRLISLYLAAKTPTTGGQASKEGDELKQQKGVNIDGVTYLLPGIKDKAALDKFTNSGMNYLITKDD